MHQTLLASLEAFIHVACIEYEIAISFCFLPKNHIFFLLIMTTTSLCYFNISFTCIHFGGYFCYIDHATEWGRGNNYLLDGWKCYFYPKTKLYIVFYLHRTKNGFIFQCLYHSEVAAKPAKLFSLFSPSLYFYVWFGMWRPPALVAMRIDVSRRCALKQSLPYLPAVFSGLCRGAASQQDDPSCWPHAPEPCLVLTALEVGLLSVCENWTKYLVYVWKVDPSPRAHFWKFSSLYLASMIFFILLYV